MEHDEMENIKLHTIKAYTLGSDDLVLLLRETADYIEVADTGVYDVIFQQASDRDTDYWEVSIYSPNLKGVE